ncbi:hypothetical protein MKX01_014065 [Papaver californicum]|nr:hypothetical protein MKX01_014065 [Papaver californicum]
MVSPENSNWFIDYASFDDIPVPGGDFPAPTTEVPWTSQTLNVSNPGVSLDFDGSFGDSDVFKETGSRKRVRSETNNTSGSKACREKMRRDRLNERFLELGSILDPGRPPKMDKAAILSDAIRMVTQLRSESQKLKESNENLQEKLKDLKVEKNELHDEKQRLKTEKEKLDQQIKAVSAQPSFIPHPAGMPAAFAAQSQAAGNKMMPFMGYPGVAMPMWQFMPPGALDTSQDHVLRPPVA